MSIGEALRPFEAHLERRDGTVVVAFQGEFDLAAVDAADSAFAEALSGDSAHIVVDLRRLSFMDCAGLRCLVKAKALAKTRGTRIAVLTGSGPPPRVMVLTELDKAFEIEDRRQLDEEFRRGQAMLHAEGGAGRARIGDAPRSGDGPDPVEDHPGGDHAAFSLGGSRSGIVGMSLNDPRRRRDLRPRRGRERLGRILRGQLAGEAAEGAALEVGGQHLGEGSGRLRGRTPGRG
jgi:anti-sigma B factor antagonist